MRDRKSLHRTALKRSLEEIAIVLTTHCNLSCRMCGYWKEREHGLPHDKVLSLLHEARELGATRFIPCGTEIFTREDTIDILSYAEHVGFHQISIVSNGTLLNNGPRIEQLAKLRTLLISISIDGPREVHDKLRGRGVYDKAVESLRELGKRGIATSISSVIMRENLEHLTKIIDLANDLGIAVISVQPYQRETAGLDNDHEAFEFRPEEERYLKKELKNILRYAVSKNIIVYTANMMDQVPPYLTRRIRPMLPDGCLVPSKFALVETSGDCYPCFMMAFHMKNKSMGNVKEKTLDMIWHKEVHHELNLLALNGQCPGCLAACSDVESYDALSQRGWMSFIRRSVSRFIS